MTFAYYRLFFVVLLLSFATLCLGQAFMQHFYDFSFIPADTGPNVDSLLPASLISGILSLLYAYILLRIMVDRRTPQADRRMRQEPIDFEERRSGIDRRTGLPC
jgi:hypothetical protein